MAYAYSLVGHSAPDARGEGMHAERGEVERHRGLQRVGATYAEQEDRRTERRPPTRAGDALSVMPFE